MPWNSSGKTAADECMAQLQHNMWVVAASSAALSIITGDGKGVEITVHADPLYQHLLLTAEKKFWRCVQTGEPPILFNIETPRPRLEAVKVIDISSSNGLAQLAATHLSTQDADHEHESAQADLKKVEAQPAEAPRASVKGAHRSHLRGLLHEPRLNSQTLRRP